MLRCHSVLQKLITEYEVVVCRLLSDPALCNVWVYLEDVFGQAIARSVRLRRKLQMKLTISSSQSVLTAG